MLGKVVDCGADAAVLGLVEPLFLQGGALGVGGRAVGLAEVPSGDRWGLCRAAVLHASAFEDGECVLLLVHEYRALLRVVLHHELYPKCVGEGLPGYLAVSANSIFQRDVRVKSTRLLSLAVFCRIIRHWTYFFFRLLNILLTLHVVFIAIRSKNSSYEFIRIGFVL